MNDSLPEVLWRRLGGALQMLENAILACPDDIWSDELKEDQFWFLAYHTLIWTDYYASENTEGFAHLRRSSSATSSSAISLSGPTPGRSCWRIWRSTWTRVAP